MFSVRDQENIVHTRPVGKSFTAPGKNGLADDLKTPLRSQKLNSNQTPGVANRLPLGLKNTNTKAHSFQTPSLAKTDVRPLKIGSPRVRRPKIQVLQADSQAKAAEHEEREIEYMPPNSVLRAALPDTPYSELDTDRSFPQFEGRNRTKGWASLAYTKDETDDEVDKRILEGSVKSVLNSLSTEKPVKAQRSNRIHASRRELESSSRLLRPTYASSTRSSSLRARPRLPSSDAKPGASLRPKSQFARSNARDGPKLSSVTKPSGLSVASRLGSESRRRGMNFLSRAPPVSGTKYESRIQMSSIQGSRQLRALGLHSDHKETSSVAGSVASEHVHSDLDSIDDCESQGRSVSDLDDEELAERLILSRLQSNESDKSDSLDNIAEMLDLNNKAAVDDTEDEESFEFNLGF